MGSRSRFTPPKGNWMSVDIQGEGIVNRYKARLVAKVYAQAHNVDYEETFVLVANMTTMRTVTTLAAAKGHLHQMDVKNAFLQGKLEEEVYMVQPSGFKSLSGIYDNIWGRIGHWRRGLNRYQSFEKDSLRPFRHEGAPLLSQNRSNLDS